MIEFSKTEPIEDDTDIPKFISIADLLERYLKDLPNIVEVAIYKTYGTSIESKRRDNNYLE